MEEPQEKQLQEDEPEARPDETVEVTYLTPLQGAQRETIRPAAGVAGCGLTKLKEDTVLGSVSLPTRDSALSVLTGLLSSVPLIQQHCVIWSWKRNFSCYACLPTAHVTVPDRSFKPGP